MSTTVENRILQMGFDNRQFESGVRDSMKSLSLFESNLDKMSGKSFSFDALGNAVADVQNKLDTFHLVAVNVLSNIANKAIETGTNLVKSLSVDNIAAGWQKFGEKTTSVGTLIAQGYELDTVNDQLERLNWFTDETSYNFTDMVSNISKFTASGKGLEESVTAMEGIANWAALSGQNASVASRAMYQISQAMGAGVMRLEDYKSIQNASMDTDEFRQKALDAAVALGTLKKAGADTYETLAGDTFSKSQFTTQLTEGGWFTSDAMMQVFNDYSKATAQIKEFQDEMGLDNASEAIEQMQEMGIEVDDFGLKAFKAAQEARTFADVIDSVKDAASTGFMTMFETLIGNYKQATELYTNMANAAYDIFVTPINDINDFLKEVFSGEDGKRETLWEGLTNAGKNLVAVIELVKESFANVFPPITVEQVKKLVDSFKEFTERIMLTDGVVRDRLEKTLTGLFSILDIGWQILQRGAKYFGGLIKAMAPGINVLLSITAGIGDFFRILDHSIQTIGFFNTFIAEGWRVAEYAGIAFENFRQSIHAAFGEDNAISKFVDELQPKFEEFVDHIHNSLADLPNAFGRISGIFGTIFGVITNFTGSLPKVLYTAGTVFEDFKMTVINAFNAIRTVLSPVAEAIRHTISTVVDTVKNAISNVTFDKVMAVGFLGLATGFRKSITGFLENVAQPFKDAGGLFKGVKDVINNVNKLLGGVKDTLSTWQQSLKADILLKIAGAIAVLTISLIMLSGVDGEGLGRSLGAMTVMLTEMFGAMYGFSKMTGDAKWMQKMGVALIAFSVAVGIFASALKKLSVIDPGALAKSLGGLFVILGEMMLFMNNANFGSKETFAGAGSFKTTEQSIIKMAEGMVLISIAVGILTKSVEKLAGMDFMGMMQGLVGMFLILGEIMVFANNTNFSDFGAGKGLGIVLLASGIIILEKAVAGLGGLDLGMIMQGLLGMFIVLGEIMLFLNHTNTAKMMSIGAGMILLSAALNMLMKPLTDIGTMNLTQAMQGLLGMFILLGEVMLFLNTTNTADVMGTGGGLILIATAITILSNALIAMGDTWKESVIGLGILAGAFIILGVVATVLTPLGPGLLMIGGAIMMIGIGVGAAGIGTLAFASALVLLGTNALIAIEGIKQITLFIPEVVNAIILGLVELIAGIAEKAPEINESIKKILISICDLIIEVTPKIVETSWLVLKAVLEMLNEHGPEILHLVIEILKGIGQTLYNDVSIVRNTVILFNKVIDRIAKFIADFIIVGKKLIEGIVEGFEAMHERLVAKAVELMIFVWERFKKFKDDFIEVGSFLIQGLIDGFKKKVDDLKNAAKELGEKAVDKLKSVLKIHSPSEVGDAIGQFFGLGFAQGIDKTKGDVENASSNLGDSAGKGILSGMNIEDTTKQFAELSNVIDTSTITLTDYNTTASTSADILGGLTANQTAYMATFDPNSIQSFTSATLQAAEATKSLSSATERNTENTEEYAKMLTKISDISQAVYADKLYDLVNDYTKAVNGGLINPKEMSMMDYIDLKQSAMGVQGMRGLLETIQDDWNAGIKMQLFTDKDVSFIDFIKERTKNFGTDNGYYDNIHVVPIDPNAYVGEDLYVTPSNIAEGVAEGMTKAAQNSAAYSAINYTNHLNQIIRSLADNGSKIAAISEKIEKIQVVLDSGTLVGELAPQVDDYLGNKMIITGRGGA